MVAFKIEEDLAKSFRDLCVDYGINQSKFLRACVTKFLNGSEAGKEKFLEELGFKKKVSWDMEP